MKNAALELEARRMRAMIDDFRAHVSKALKTIEMATRSAIPIDKPEELEARLKSRSAQSVNRIEKLLK